MTATRKHATATVFLFTRAERTGWRLGLIRHPRFDRWMPPGGHVEEHENPAEAALREVTEETGCQVRLIGPPGGIPHAGGAGAVAMPLWIVEHQVPAESRHPHPHVHVDHLYLAVAAEAVPERTGELPFAWYAGHQLDDLDMFPDSQACARVLFANIGEYADQILHAAAR